MVWGLGGGRDKQFLVLKKARSLWKVQKASNLDGFFETNYATELKEKKQDEDGKIT
jgi:hypothetical protein